MKKRLNSDTIKQKELDMDAEMELENEIVKDPMAANDQRESARRKNGTVLKLSQKETDWLKELVRKSLIKRGLSPEITPADTIMALLRCPIIRSPRSKK